MKAQGVSYAHLGGYQTKGSSKDDPWFWEGGQKFGFTAWKGREPNNWGGREDCMITYQNGWNDDQCSKKTGYVCEYK